MTTCVALLRGVNVGTHNRVAMADLRSTLADAGFGDVVTHLQSGNLVLNSGGRRPAALETALEQALRRGSDLDVAVVVRSASELAKTTRSNPFLRGKADPKMLHVGFVKSKPTAAASRELARADFGREEFALRGKDLYLRYPNGMGRAKMTASYFERILETPITVRNWAVTTKLVELAGA